MDEQQNKRGGSGKILWLLVVLVMVVLWWYFRPDGDRGAAQAQLDADTAAAVTDPDDILIDLVDDAAPDAIERALGIDLVLVSDAGTAERTKLFRAHVDPARRDAILAELARRGD